MDATTELRNLKFTPRSSAWRHVQKFEKLAATAYPKIADADKWSLFVKTIDSNNNTWSSRNGQTPSQWLMDLNEQWIRDNPPCEDPDCNDCKNDCMSFEHLKNSFLERWASDERPTRRHPHPGRAYSLPPQSTDSGSETESGVHHRAGNPHASHALVPHNPHNRSALQLPPSAPTPPNELAPESDDDEVVQETKTSISINAEHGAGQIVLSISDNKAKKKRKKPVQQLPPPSPPSDISSESRNPSPVRHPHNQVQVIEADPAPPPGMELYQPESPTRPPTPPREMATPPPPPLRPRLLEGKVAAITGASRGIGRALALGFAREGAHIVAHYWGTKSDPANEEIVSLCVDVRSLGQGCTIVFGDISDPRTSETIIRRAVETYGHLDIAVSNAGMLWYRDFLDVTPELLRRHVDVNLNGAFYFVQAAARQFKRQCLAEPADAPMRDYSVICVAAPAAGAATEKVSHYSPAAAGVRELMKSCAAGLAKFGVRCNTLAPGVTQTKMVKEVMEDAEQRGRVEKRCPFGRVGVPGDVVGPAVWLAGEMGKWVTGQEIVVDGGAASMAF